MFLLKNFIITFLHKITSFLKSPKFPKDIIPNTGFLAKISLDDLINEQNLIIIRRSDKSFDETFNSLGILREDALFPKEIPFLSLNILGGKFSIEHSKFRIIKNGIERWDGTKNIKLKDFTDSYLELEEYCIIFMNANKISNQNFPYNQTKTSEIKNEIEAFFNNVGLPKITGGEYHLSGTTKLVHDPINLNYWHAELTILDFKNQAIKFKKSKYIEKICQEVLTNIICINSFSKQPEITPIPEFHYTKK